MKKKILVCLALWVVFSISGQGTPIALEQFDYPGNNTLAGDGAAGGGWAGAWRGNWWTASGGSLAPTGTTITPVAGNRVVSNGARSFRDLSTAYDDSVTQTVYLSFLFQDAGASGYSTIELFNGGDSDALNRTFQLGGLEGDSDGNPASVTARANNDVGTVQVIGARTTDVDFYLVQIDFVNGGNDTISIWRNPDTIPGVADATITVSSFAFDRIALGSFSGTDLYIDEIRLGTAQEDVMNAAGVTYPIEQFDYPGNNTLAGDGAAADGWAGAWRGNWWTASGGSLAPTPTTIIPVAGNRVVSSGSRSFRDLSTVFNDGTTQTLYLSFLFQDAGASGYGTFELFNGGDSEGVRVFQLGGLSADSGGNPSLVTARANNDGATLQTMGARTTDVDFYLIQIDFVSGGDDTISIWRNPDFTPGAADATITIPSFAFDRVALGSFEGTDLYIDEIRFGAALADVMNTAAPAYPVEPFDYSVSADFEALTGKGSAGDGWGSAWYVGGNNSWVLRNDGSLPATPETILPVTGLRVISGDGRSYRDLDQTYDDSISSTLYLSLLTKEDALSIGPYKALEFYNTSTASVNRTFQLGSLAADGTADQSQVSARVYNNPALVAGMGIRTTDTEFYLIKIDFDSAGDDTISIWRNPGTTPGAADAVITTASFAFDRIAIASFGSSVYQVDEIRFGASLSEVMATGTPAPLPIYPVIAQTGSGLSISFISESGVTYSLESSSDLGATDPWADTGETPIVGDGGPQEFLLEPAPALPAFFRVSY